MDSTSENDEGTGRSPKIVKPNSIQLALSLGGSPAAKPL